MGKLIFITGGVRSGKSAYAEKYAKEFYQEYDCRSLIYIASGVAFDEEMKNRIMRHRRDRDQSILKWETIEIQDKLYPDQLHKDKPVILWDCITTWLNNVLFSTERLEERKRINAINSHVQVLKKQLLDWQSGDSIVLVVSNELLDEPHSSYPEVNFYRLLLGNLHQWIVDHCDEAYEMDYSISKRWK